MSHFGQVAHSRQRPPNKTATRVRRDVCCHSGKLCKIFPKILHRKTLDINTRATRLLIARGKHFPVHAHAASDKLKFFEPLFYKKVAFSFSEKVQRTRWLELYLYSDTVRELLGQVTYEKSSMSCQNCVHDESNRCAYLLRSMELYPLSQ